MPARNAHPCVLCLDDDPNIRDGFVRRFQKVYEVTVAAAADAALEQIQGGRAFAVIVSDLRLPGMNGLEFLARARDLAPDSVCVMLTGYAETDVAIKAVNEGRIFRFLTKP